MNDDSMKTIGRYIIDREIGRGGMAIVYQAHDPQLDRVVAIKLIRKSAFPPEQLAPMTERFRREVKALAKLNHPNIVKALDYGVHEDAPYLVMEYLEGITLKDVRKPLRVDAAVRLLWPVAEALEYVHDHGILHRDVKPSNIMITATKKVMLTDFGIAKWLEDPLDQFTLTGTGIGIGTPEYMAPEQGLGKKIDARADMYALTVVFYELITGRKPFSGETPLEVLTKQVSDPIPDPRTIIPDLNESVKKFLDRAMAKKPEDRYPTMMDYLRDLDGLRLQALTAAARKTQSGETTGIQTVPKAEAGTESSVRFGKTDFRKVREAAEGRSGQAPKVSGEDNTGRLPTKTEDHRQNQSAAVRKSNRLRWLLPAVGLLAILACWIGIQRLAGRLPVEPMGTPTEMILDVERSQTDIPMIGMEPTAVVNHQGKGTSVQSGTVFPSEFIPIAMPETEPAVVQGLTLIEPQQEIIETQSPERKMATHTAIAEQKKAALYETVTAFNQRLTETKQGYQIARNSVPLSTATGTPEPIITPAFEAAARAQDLTSTAAKLNFEETAIAVHQKETELAVIVTEMTLTAVAAERSRLTEEAAARAQAERIRLTELSLPTETPGPAATESPFAKLHVGDIIEFGRYEQDNYFENGPEPIEWLVLDVSNGSALLISRYGLDAQAYHTVDTGITWANCTLRKWLNEIFYDEAFSQSEKQLINLTKVENPDNPEQGTPGGADTEDKIFLLSDREFNRYFTNDELRIGIPTLYAKSNGAYINPDNGNSWWWLRSPGISPRTPLCISSTGSIYKYGGEVTHDYGVVRPVLRLNSGIQ